MLAMGHSLASAALCFVAGLALLRTGTLPEPGHVQADDNLVAVRGRAVDEDGVPFAGQDLAIEMRKRYDGDGIGSISVEESASKTDGFGEFELRIPRTVPNGWARWAVGRIPGLHEGERVFELEPCARFDLPASISGSHLDLGELRFCAPASSTRFSAWSDGQIVDAIRSMRDAGGNDEDRSFEGLLCEVVRRGGADWERFLDGEWLRDVQGPSARRADGKAFELLTALRRVQREPDPLAIEIQADSQPFLEDVSRSNLHLRFKNADTGGATITTSATGNEWFGVPNRWRVELRTLDGQTQLLQRQRGGGFTIKTSEKTLAPQEFLEVRLIVSEYLDVPIPGVYEVRVLYHDHSDLSSVTDVGNLIVSSSPWTRFEVPNRVPRVWTLADLRALLLIASAVLLVTLVVTRKVIRAPRFERGG